MTTPSDQTPARSATADEAVERKVGLSRAIIVFERVWSLLHWPMIVAALLAASVIGGVLPLLPVWPRLAVLILFAAALAASLRPLLSLSWPSRHEAMRRIEDRTGLAHRPVSAQDDRLAQGADDPV